MAFSPQPSRIHLGCRRLALSCSFVALDSYHVWQLSQSALSYNALGSRAPPPPPQTTRPSRAGTMSFVSSSLGSSPRQGSKQAIKKFSWVVWKGPMGYWPRCHRPAHHCLLDLCRGGALSDHSGLSLGELIGDLPCPPVITSSFGWD